MTAEMEQLKLQIDQLKFKMAEAWDEKGETDQKVLGISIEIDELLNKYYRLSIGRNIKPTNRTNC